MPLARKRILPYKGYSKGAKILSQELEILRLRRGESSRFHGIDQDVIVNWGSSTPHRDTCRAQYINRPECIRISGNKLSSFRFLSQAGIPVPEWTTDKDKAQEWLNAGHTVFCRTLLQSHSGRGIITVEPGGTVIPHAPLYTKRIKRNGEYRVHVFRGSIIDIQQKKRRNGSARGGLVWNHGNGYVYCREGVVAPDGLNDLAIRACAAIGLDFGAVDIIVDKQNNPIILEINSAPGLVGSTIEKYKDKFKSILNYNDQSNR